MSGNELVDQYVALLQRRAAETDEIGRFFVWGSDALRDLENRIEEADASDKLGDTLLRIYGEWKAGMAPEQWRKVVERNNSLNGANQNALIDELDD